MANELFALLTEAKTVYLHDVVSGGKQYHRYVDDFVNGHRYIDCHSVPPLLSMVSCPGRSGNQ
ncbi:hypothetical protein GAQ33_03430 [Bacteroides uniformis]|nr:hypothetical protein GAQ33_03430 [Bacteroides uniformis]KAB4177051.1 hypothetical protein GAQ05_10435 [Bacteroides uniformis]